MNTVLILKISFSKRGEGSLMGLGNTWRSIESTAEMWRAPLEHGWKHRAIRRSEERGRDGSARCEEPLLQIFAKIHYPYHAALLEIIREKLAIRAEEASESEVRTPKFGARPLFTCAGLRSFSPGLHCGRLPRTLKAAAFRLMLSICVLTVRKS